MKKLPLIILLSLSTIALGQNVNDASDNEEETIHISKVTVAPTFKGNSANSFTKWVNTQLHYPEESRKKGIEGTVLMGFTVMADGSVADIKVIRGVDYFLDKEAVRVISKSPKWEPGQYNGRTVNVVYFFPVIFKLHNRNMQ